VAPLQFTPGQLRSTVGLSKETFRHWKRVVPAFSNRRGHSPAFTPGDVLASAILRGLTNSCGIRIGRLSEAVTKIFDACNRMSWAALSDQVLVVNLPSGSCNIVPKAIALPTDRTAIVYPLASIIEDVKTELLHTERWSAKPHLSLAPDQPVAGSNEQRRAG
jgi:hypothetical protein